MRYKSFIILYIKIARNLTVFPQLKSLRVISLIVNQCVLQFARLFAKKNSYDIYIYNKIDQYYTFSVKND